MHPMLQTRSGWVRGREESGVLAFRGIPYARAPTGVLRWRPPLAEIPWPGVRDALELAPDAVQFGDGGGSFDDEQRPESEESLVVNVWTPGLGAGERAIMVFIHGGSFCFGGSGRRLYDGRFLASEGEVVVVTLNYRLGPLGLLSHPSLTDVETGHAANWALLDQIAALRWVREHADAIGGNADAITVFGESAGSASVGALCVIPQAQGLFQRAIMQSGAPTTVSMGRAEDAADAYSNALQLRAPAAESLREVSVDRLKTAQQIWIDRASWHGYALRPCPDRRLLPDAPLSLARSGVTREIELVVGTNRDELNSYAMTDRAFTALTDSELSARVSTLVSPARRGLDVPRLIEHYRDSRAAQGLPVEAWRLYAAIAGDYLVRLDSLRFLEHHVRAGGRGYLYHFDWESPNPLLGACHGMELPFCFGTLETAPGMPAFAGGGANARRLRERMIDTWSTFARGENQPFGAVFDPKAPEVWQLGRRCGPLADPSQRERRAWKECQS